MHTQRTGGDKNKKKRNSGKNSEAEPPLAKENANFGGVLVPVRPAQANQDAD